MIVSISGTPGTGKSKIARLLGERLNAKLLVINDIIKELPYTIDKKRKTKIIDIRNLQKAVNKIIDKNKINIIEGHLSHLLHNDIIFILRTNPLMLKKRLKRKRWPKQKINENLQAEILGNITIDVLKKYGRRKRAYEIDTSNEKPNKVVKIMIKIINGKINKKYKIGQIDWTKKYVGELIKIDLEDHRC